jgi:transcriptional regulator with XRE-family HTH domain
MKILQVRYDEALMLRDIAERGTNAYQLAIKAKLSPTTVNNFLNGRRQTAKTMHKLAKALRARPAQDYIIGVERVLDGEAVA